MDLCLRASRSFSLNCTARSDHVARKAFTLIELLVVISILVLLIALLLPVLASARAHTKIMMCLSNLRQMNTALYSYAADNDGMGPAYRRDGSDQPRPNYVGGFYDWNLVYFGGHEEGGTWWGNSSGTEVRGRRKLNDYVTDVRMFLCPSDTGKVPSNPGNPNMFYDHTGTSYLYNSNWYGVGGSAGTPISPGQPPWTLYGVVLESVGPQSLVYSFADATMLYAFPFWPNPQGPHAGEFNWHDSPENHPGEFPNTGTINAWFYDPLSTVAFLDGHASLIRLGPHAPGDANVNGERYTVDPNHWLP